MLKLSRARAVAALPVRLHHASALRPAAAGGLPSTPRPLLRPRSSPTRREEPSRSPRRSAKRGITTFCAFSFESSGHNGHPQNLVEGQYFRSRSPGAKPLVVVMPIWGTSNYPPSKISNGYARHSHGEAHVIWIYGTAPLFPWDDLAAAPTEEDFVAMSRDSVERYRIGRDRHAPAPRLGRDARRNRCVADRVRRFQHERAGHGDADRQRRAHRRGGAHDGRRELRRRVRDLRRPSRRGAATRARRVRLVSRPSIESSFKGCSAPPIRCASPDSYDPDRILMIDAMFDDCMPESSRAALWEVAGHPERITLLYRHRARVLLADAARLELRAPQDLSVPRQDAL